MRSIGLDLGSTTTIAAEVINGVVETVIVPSVLAPLHLAYRELPDHIDYGIETNGNGSLHKTHLSIDGLHYWGGHNAWRGRTPLQRFDNERFYQREQLGLSLLALAGLPDANGAGFEVQIAVPQNLTIDRNRLELFRSQMENTYLGKHHFALNGERWTMTIERINIDSQPKMGFFAMGFDTSLTWVLGPDFKSSDSFVLFDQGGNDFGIISIDNGKIVSDKCRERQLGMTKCAKDLLQRLEKSYAVRDLTVWEADELIQQAVDYRDGDESARATIRVNGYPRDVTEEALSALDQFIPLCVNFAYDVVGEATSVGKMIVGGGTYALHKPLSQVFGHITKPTGDPITMIARGAAIVAQWKFQQ